ncbi:MAG: DUF190 domain-containing protein [Bacteroidota bacterium]
MDANTETLLLRIYTGSLDKINSTPLYETIVHEAKNYGIAGATVLRGIMSYGAHSFIHTAKILAVSDDLPIIIEMIDEADKINAFVKTIEKYFDNPKHGGLITLEKVNVVFYKPGKS